MVDEQVYRPAGAAISGRVTPAAFPFFTTGEDSLRVTSFNSVTGVTLKVVARLLGSDGRPSPDSWTHTPATDRSAKSDDFPLSGLTLLNLTVFAGAGSPLIGQTFVIVQLIRGIGTAAIVLGTILQGYVTGTQAIGWPGSPIQDSISGGGVTRFIQGTDPPAGAQISETVPTGARWELLTIGASLTTSVAAGNRRPRLTITSGAVHLIDNYHPATVIASTSAGFAWGAGTPQPTAFTATAAYSALVQGLPLRAGDLIGIDHEGGAAGDNWGAPLFYVREWLEAA